MLFFLQDEEKIYNTAVEATLEVIGGKLSPAPAS